MTKNSKHNASIPNPALKIFDVLIGKWQTVGTHPEVPNITLHGHSSFKWIEGGAFLVWYSEMTMKVFLRESPSSAVMIPPGNILYSTLTSGKSQESMMYHSKRIF